MPGDWRWQQRHAAAFRWLPNVALFGTNTCKLLRVQSSDQWSSPNYRPGKASCELSQATMTRVASCSMGATSISSVVAVGILSLQRTLSRCYSCSGSVVIHHNTQVFRKKNLKTSCKPQTSKRSKHRRCWTASWQLPSAKSASTPEPAPSSLRLRPPTPLVRGWGWRHGCLGGSACTCQPRGFWFGWPSLHLEAGLWKKCWVLGNWLILDDLRRGALQDMLVIADETQCVGRLVDNPNYFHVQVHLCNDMQGDCIPHLKLDGREWTFVMYRYVMMLQLDWIGVYEYVSRYSGRILVKSRESRCWWTMDRRSHSSTPFVSKCRVVVLVRPAQEELREVWRGKATWGGFILHDMKTKWPLWPGEIHRKTKGTIGAAWIAWW